MFCKKVNSCLDEIEEVLGVGEWYFMNTGTHVVGHPVNHLHSTHTTCKDTFRHAYSRVSVCQLTCTVASFLSFRL